MGWSFFSSTSTGRGPRARASAVETAEMCILVVPAKGAGTSVPWDLVGKSSTKYLWCGNNSMKNSPRIKKTLEITSLNPKRSMNFEVYCKFLCVTATTFGMTSFRLEEVE